MHRLLLAAAVVAAPALAHGYGGDNDIATIGFTGSRLHVEWVWDGASDEVHARVMAWKYDEVAQLYRGKQVTCSDVDLYLVCAVEIDRKGKVRAPRYLLAFGDVAHPTDPIRGSAASMDERKRVTTVFRETPGVLIWAWIDGAEDDGESRASAHVRCRTDNATGGEFSVACGLSFDAKGRVRAADPM